MRSTYRACYYSHEGGEIVLTSPDEFGLSESALIEAAIREARRPDCGLIDPDGPTGLDEATVRARFIVGEWQE